MLVTTEHQQHHISLKVWTFEGRPVHMRMQRHSLSRQSESILSSPWLKLLLKVLSVSPRRRFLRLDCSTRVYSLRWPCRDSPESRSHYRTLQITAHSSVMAVVDMFRRTYISATLTGIMILRQCHDGRINPTRWQREPLCSYFSVAGFRFNKFLQSRGSETPRGI